MVISRSRLLSWMNSGLGLLIGVPIIVLGTYGTADGGLDSSGTIYLRYAYPAALLAVACLFMRDIAARRRVSLFAFTSPEFHLLLLIFFLILLSTFRLPQYILTAGLTAAAGILGVLFVTNHVDRESRFSQLFASYQLLVYVTAVLALISGVYSFHVGPFTVGPLLIEYNKAFWRVNAWYVTSTGLGLFFCQGIFAAYYFRSKSRSGLAKAFHLVMPLGFTYGIALAGARTGFIVPIASFFLLWVARSWPPRFVSLAKLALLAGIFAGAIGYVIANYSEEIYLLRRLQGEDASSLGGRTEFLAHAFGEMANYSASQLLLGVGVNGIQQTLGWTVSAHSGVLRFMLEYGLLMLLLYGILSILLLAGAVKRVISRADHREENAVLLLSVSSYLFAEFIVIQLFGISIEFLMFIATLSFFICLKQPLLRRDGSEMGAAPHTPVSGNG